MLRRTLLTIGSIVMIGAGIVVAGQARNQKPGHEDKTREGLAQEVFDALSLTFFRRDLDSGINVVVHVTDGLAEVDQLYRWSEHLTMAQSDGLDGPSHREAIQGHISRMKAVEEEARRKYNSKQLSHAVVSAASYYRRTAESRLAALEAK